MKKVGAVLLAWAASAATAESFSLAMVLEKHSVKKFRISKTVLDYKQANITVEEDRFHLPKKKTNQVLVEKAPFAPWPTPMIETRGDYRDEDYLEDPLTPLYEHQHKLPRLPIPSLEETIDRFLPTALPLCENEEEKRSLREAAAQFAEQAQDLQTRLQQRQQEDMADTSWLQHWWNTLGYLQVRDPVPVNVNYFLSIDTDDPTIVPHVPPHERGIYRAAAVLSCAAEIRKRVCGGQMMADIGPKQAPFCSTGYKYLFHACRIPRRHQDTVKLFDPSRFTHCIVACRGSFFKVEFVDQVTQNPIPLHVLVERLKLCEKLARELEINGAPQLGWLTGCDRDTWADARIELQQIGGQDMKKALEVLESGAFLLCLDQDMPDSPTESAQEFWHGNTQDGAHLNRWFDKSIQFMVARNGKMALMAEHSMFDGMTPMALITHILKNNYRKIQRREEANHPPSCSDESSGVSHIFEKSWSNPQVVDQVQGIVQQAKHSYDGLTDSVQIEKMVFHDYGKTLIKKAGISPDAYLQMAIQLAGSRVFGSGKQVGTYEATQTKRFLHGRTETTRTVSTASEEFVQAMNDEDASMDAAQLLEKLQRATQAHHDYTLDATNGLGVDRHFLGLSLCLQDGEEAPSLYSHPAFAESKTWRLSTSSLPYCPGFGPVVPNGVGIGYANTNDSCIFVVTARKDTGYVPQMCKHLKQALREMEELLALYLAHGRSTKGW